VSDLLCVACGRTSRTAAVYPPRCVCGGLWSAADPSLYAIRSADVGAPTPLWPDPVDRDLLWKREDLNRTGSFKDRGADTLAAVALRAGATRLVVDSSGSAALAAASAAARAGLPVTVHTPGDLPPAKRHALEMMGAGVVAEGDRAAAAARAAEAAAREFHFSHVAHPAFFEGTGRSAIEALEQCDGRPPGTWLVPVGNGSLFLGIAHALDRLECRSVRLIAVQASACPGLRSPGTGRSTRATGIAIADPPRRSEILAALARQGGDVIEVSEEEIESAHGALGRRGVAAERASAAALAGVRALRSTGEGDSILAWLTGSGLRG
jgi:threonine synthase